MNSRAQSAVTFGKRLKNFEKARKLLETKKVPFDPHVLLDPNWRKTLKRTLDQMPELQTIKRGGDRLKGVQLAYFVDRTSLLRLGFRSSKENLGYSRFMVSAATFGLRLPVAARQRQAGMVEAGVCSS